MDPAEDALALDAADERVASLRADLLAAAPTESVPLAAVAGRTLAEPVVADADVPPRDRATMDGFAVVAGHGGPRSVVDAAVYPEDDPPEIDTSEAVEVATGAGLPAGADAVLKREDVAVADGQLRGPPIEPGTNVHERASNVAAGERLFAAGERLSPKDAVLLRDLGVEPVTVHERPSVGVLATGTEIHEGRQPDRDSPMLVTLARSYGADAAFEGSVPDDYDRVEGRFAKLADAHDVVVTTGGTSVGDRDYAVRALDALGELVVRGIAVRPGRPATVARLPDRDAVAVALPGKPLAAHTAAVLLLRPLLVGERPRPTVDAEVARDVGIRDDGLTYAVPVSLSGSDGDRAAMPLGHVDSPLAIYEDRFRAGVLASSTRATRADGIVLTETDLDAGQRVGVVPYPSLE